MRNKSRNIIAAAAFAGLLGGAALHEVYARDGATNSAGTNSVAGQAALKAPTAHTCAGQNDCKGLGGCKSGDNGCKFKNSCKGKGGCDITAKDIKDWKKAHKTAS